MKKEINLIVEDSDTFRKEKRISNGLVAIKFHATNNYNRSYGYHEFCNSNSISWITMSEEVDATIEKTGEFTGFTLENYLKYKYPIVVYHGYCYITSDTCLTCYDKDFNIKWSWKEIPENTKASVAINNTYVFMFYGTYLIVLNRFNGTKLGDIMLQLILVSSSDKRYEISVNESHIFFFTVNGIWIQNIHDIIGKLNKKALSQDKYSINQKNFKAKIQCITNWTNLIDFSDYGISNAECKMCRISDSYNGRFIMAVYECTSRFSFNILIDLKREIIQCKHSPIATSNSREIDSWYLDDEFNVKCVTNKYFYDIFDHAGYKGAQLPEGDDPISEAYKSISNVFEKFAI